MKKIVALLRPFQYEQTLFVYEDGNKIDMAEATVDELNDSFFGFLEKYPDIDHIDLTGPKQYSAGIKKKFQEKEISKYEVNKVNVNII